MTLKWDFVSENRKIRPKACLFYWVSVNDFAPGMCLELETVTVSKWFLWLDESNVFRSEFFCNESLIFEKILMNLKRNV